MSKEKILLAVNDLANVYGPDHRSNFMEVMKDLHPTCQQLFMGLCFNWINEMAKMRTDPRNEASAAVCRRLVDLYSADTGEDEIPSKFPFI